MNHSGGILLLATNDLPAELAYDASFYFSQNLLPWLYEMATTSINQPPSIAFSSKTLANAVVTWKGSLAEKYTYIESLRSKQSQKVLLLGSGHVSQPLIAYLLKNDCVSITVASNQLEEAKSVYDTHAHIQPIFLDVRDEASLQEQVASHDLVVSLLPATLHPSVARACLMHRKHLVTTSYVSDEMQKLHER
jgi:alpha-aminoadipic semialdehyde synthase